MREPHTIAADKVIWLTRMRPDLCRVRTFPGDTKTELDLAEKLEQANIRAIRDWLLSGRTLENP